MKPRIWKHCGWWYCSRDGLMNGAGSGRTPHEAWLVWLTAPL